MEEGLEQLDTAMGVAKYADGKDPIPETRRNLVKEILTQVTEAKAHWEPRFKIMRRSMEIAYGRQWEQVARGLKSEQLYVANITNRHVQQRTAALYAKNPRIVAKRRERMDYTVWDGTSESIQKARDSMLLAMESGDPNLLDPNALAVVQDYEKVLASRAMYDRMGKTLEILAKYFVDEQVVPYKKQMKRLVRRAITCGVAYKVLGFQRILQQDPEVVRQLADHLDQMNHLERIARESGEADFDRSSADLERLKLLTTELTQKTEIIAREGLVFDWPSSTCIIPDKKCRQLDGFVGADFVAQEYMLTPQLIKEIFDVDVKSAFTAYTQVEPGTRAVSNSADGAPGMQLACVYRVEHKRDGLWYWVCDGFPDFLREPTAPPVKLERFWTIFALCFNEVEHEGELYPPSDVELMWPMQMDHNRARQAFREHRRANRPMTVVAAGRLEDTDKEALRDRPDNALIELQGLQPGEKVEDLLQAYKPPTVDPAIYATEPAFDDLLKVVGTQEANFGGTSNATATESSISESSRLSGVDSNVDDLDEFMTDVFRSGGQVLLQEVSTRVVREIVGPGAVWPELTREEVVKEIFLEIEAGSSGRPNQAQQIQNFERMVPYLIQIPGIKPTRLAEEGIRRLDDKLDLSSFIEDGLPSISMLNSQKQPPRAGGAESDPNQQGSKGGNNTAQPGQGRGDPGRPGRPPMDPNLDVDPVSGMAVS